MCKAERAGLQHTTLDLENGEYITAIEGRTGNCIDAMKFRTSKGRELRCGGNGGSESKPVFNGKKPCIVAIEGTLDGSDRLKNVKYYYIDLDEVEVN